MAIESNFNEWVQHLESKYNSAIEMIEHGMAGEVQRIVNDAKANTPVNTGMLRNSIRAERAGRTTWYVGSHVSYAAAIEYGTKPHMPPSNELKYWARRKLGNEKLAYAIARKIAQRGTKPHRMFRNALSARAPRIKQLIDYAMKKMR
jgi:phage gpG-like protein